eukprot:4125452-Amphidinium_carterae.1
MGACGSGMVNSAAASAPPVEHRQLVRTYSGGKAAQSNLSHTRTLRRERQAGGSVIVPRIH